MQATSIHRRDEVQHGSPGATGKAGKDIFPQVGMKGITALAPVNRAAATILIPSAAAQFHLVVPQQRRQFDAALNGCKIYPVLVLHGRLRSLSAVRRRARFGAYRHGPDEAQPFAANGGYDLGLVLTTCRQFLVASAPSPLRLPRDGFDLLLQTLLPLGQPASDPRLVLIGPGRFHHHTSEVRVAGLGDRTRWIRLPLEYSLETMPL